MPHFNRHFKRQAPGTTLDVGSGDGLGGAFTISNGNTAAATGDLIQNTGAATQAIPTDAIPTLAASFTLTTSDTTVPTSTAEPTASQASSQAISGSSSLSTGAVVAACVGAFVGLAILICVFIWWTRHNTTKRSGGIPRSPMAENRNARGEADQQKTRSGLWNKLDDGRGGRLEEMPAEDEDEKNFSMFKKSRTMSMRTTRTAKALEEHGIDMPPLTKYHPDLAQQLELYTCQSCHFLEHGCDLAYRPVCREPIFLVHVELYTLVIDGFEDQLDVSFGYVLARCEPISKPEGSVGSGVLARSRATRITPWSGR